MLSGRFVATRLLPLVLPLFTAAGVAALEMAGEQIIVVTPEDHCAFRVENLSSGSQRSLVITPWLARWQKPEESVDSCLRSDHCAAVRVNIADRPESWLILTPLPQVRLALYRFEPIGEEWPDKRPDGSPFLPELQAFEGSPHYDKADEPVVSTRRLDRGHMFFLQDGWYSLRAEGAAADLPEGTLGVAVTLAYGEVTPIRPRLLSSDVPDAKEGVSVSYLPSAPREEEASSPR